MHVCMCECVGCVVVCVSVSRVGRCVMHVCVCECVGCVCSVCGGVGVCGCVWGGSSIGA